MSQPTPPTTPALVLAVRDGAADWGETSPARSRILGMPVLARTLYALQQAGIPEAYIVIDHDRREAEALIRNIPQIVMRTHWIDSDGYADCPVLAAESAIQEPFIITTSGVLFDPGVVEELRRNAEGLRGIDIVIDRDLDGRLPNSSHPKVRASSDRAIEWGARLPTFDGVDTGIYLASPGLFRAAREIGDSGPRPLSRLIERSVDAGDARVADVQGRRWQRFDSPADTAAMEQTLLASVRKATDGPVSKYLNRPISMAMSRVLVRTRVTPNQITALGLVLGLGSGVFAAIGGYLGFLAAGILFQFTSILDGVDGEIAKLTLRSSRRGEWFDTAADGITAVAFLIGMVVGVYRTESTTYLLFGIVSVAAAVITLVNLYIYLMLSKGSGSLLAVTYWYQRKTGFLSRVFQLLHYLGKRDVFAFLTFFLAVIGQMPFVLILFGTLGGLLLAPTAVSVNLILLWRTWRARRARTGTAPAASLER